MLFQAEMTLVLALLFSVVTACGGGAVSEKEAETEAASSSETEPTTKPVTAANKPTKAGPIIKGEATDVTVPSDSKESSLTLVNVGNNKLSWNEAAVGTVYSVWQRPMVGTYSSDQPFQTLTDMSSLSLTEIPGHFCYKVTAALPGNRESIESNEVCIQGPALLVAPDPAAVQVVAGQALSLTMVATAGSQTLHWSCLSACPSGLAIAENSGDLSWTPGLAQLGTHQPVLRVQTGSQRIDKTLSIFVAEPALSVTPLGPLTVTAKQLLTNTLSATAGGLPLQFSCVSGCPAGFVMDSSSGAISWTPTLAQIGSAQPIVRVAAGSQQADQTLTITIHEPILTFSAPSTARIVATEAFHTALLADAGGMSIQWSCVSACPSGLTINSTTGAVDWTPTAAQTDDYQPLMRAAAGSQAVERTLSLEVVQAFLNIALTSSGALRGEQTIGLNAAPHSNLQASPSFSIQQTAGPTVTVSPVSDGWTFLAPNVRQVTTLSFTIHGTIGSITRDETIHLLVVPNDHAPTLAAFSIADIIATESWQITALASDPDGDTLTFACVLNCPAGMVIDASSGVISWQPDLLQSGAYTPSIQVEANGQTANEVLNLIVQAPTVTLSAPAISGIAGETVNFVVTPNTNLRGTLSYSITQTVGPIVSLSGSAGSWSFVVPTIYSSTPIAFQVVTGNGIYSRAQSFNGVIDPEPIAPTVNVGPDLITNHSLSVSATVSPNSQSLTWSKVSGPGTLSFGNNTGATTSISATVDGTYVVRLTASNYWGQTGSDDLQLIWDTTPPGVNSGSDVATNSIITRNATVTGASSLQWTKTSGAGTLIFSAPTASSTTLDADSDGDYTVRLTAQDAAGNSAFSEFILTVDKTSPIITFGSAIVDNSADQALSPTVSSDAVTFSWYRVAGPGSVQFTSPDQVETEASFSADGVYTIRLTATDGFGNSRTGDLSVTIDQQAPSIAALTLAGVVADGYLNTVEYQSATALIHAASATDLTEVSYGYTLISSGSPCDENLTFATSIPLADDSSFTSSGNYRVCVRARDIFNQSAFAESPDIIYDTGTVSVVLSQLPAANSRDSALNVLTGGSNVTHYKFKVGAAAATNCADEANYSAERDVSLVIDTDLSALPDDTMRICAIGRNISGNWQSTASARQFDWILDRTAPQQPQNLVATGLVKRNKFNWTLESGVAAYLLVRRSGSPVDWQPNPGQNYSSGEVLDAEHNVVSRSPGQPAFDDSPVPGTSYHYAIFPFDSAYNYGPAAHASAVATTALAFNSAVGFDRIVRVIVPTRDASDKYYVAGDFTIHGSKPSYRILRLNADLTVDTTFTAPAINAQIYALAVAADNKVYAAGAFTAGTGYTQSKLIRLHSDGKVDNSFVVGTGFNSTVQSLALDESLNRLYVGGAFTTYKGTTRNRLVALNLDDGSVDSSFDCGTCITTATASGVYAMSVIPGQNLYIGGSFTVLNGTTVNRIARLTATGAIDTTFMPGSGTVGFNNTVFAIERDSNNNLLVGGQFTSYRNSSNGSRFTRLLTSNGAIDTSWPTTNKFNGTVYSIKVDSDGSLYVAGDFAAFGSNVVARIARVSSTGVIDSSFATAGGAMSGAAANGGFPILTMHLASDHLLIGGSFLRFAVDNVGYLAQINKAGVLSSTSPRGTFFNNASYAITGIGSNGDMLVGGYFTSYKGAQTNRVARISKAGVLNTGTANAITTSAYVYALAVDSSTGKFYTGGTFTAPSGRLARFNADGTADVAFNTAISTTGFNSDVLALATDASSGSVYVGGKFTTLKNAGMSTAVSSRYIARLLPTGSIDTSFDIGTGFNGQVNAIVLMDDGTVLVGGSFTSYNGMTANRLIRLNPDGSPFNGFEIGSGFSDSIYSLRYVPSEHAIYAGGTFKVFRGISTVRVAKLDETGQAFSGFTFTSSNGGASSTVYAMDWDPQNEVLWIGGAFGTVNKAARSRLAAINRDGSLHTAFQPGAVTFNSDVRGILVNNYGVHIATIGSSYKNQVIDYLARVIFDSSLQ